MAIDPELVKSLSHYKLFSGFTAEDIAQIVRFSSIRHLQPGEVLIASGTQNHTLYLIMDGEIRVILEKDETRVSIPIETGECIGEMSLVMGRPTSAWALSHTQSRVLAISEEIFWSNLAVTRQGVKNLMSLMAERLHRNNNALIHEIEEQLKYKQLENDLETAGKIQSNIVPDGTHLFPNRPEIEVYALMKQAREVGGDFYDAAVLDADHIYFAIGDATGKGMPASLFMMRTFTSLRWLVSDRPNFEEVLPTLNNMLVKNNEDMMFVSIWTGILDVRTGLLRFVNGGHNPPFVKHGNGTFKLLQRPHGPIVGVLEEAQYEVVEIALSPGDTIFLYTDGLPEAYNPEHVAFETDGIEKALNSMDHPSMKNLISFMDRQVEAFVQDAPTHDDMTMLALRYLGEGPVPEKPA